MKLTIYGGNEAFKAYCSFDGEKKSKVSLAIQPVWFCESNESMSFDFIDVSLDKPFQEVNTSQKDNAMLLYVIKGQGEQRMKGYGQDSRIRLEVDSVQLKILKL